VLDVYSFVFIHIKFGSNFKKKLLQYFYVLPVTSKPVYSTRAIVLIVLSVRLAAFTYKLSLGNLEVGSECHAKYRRTYCVVARKTLFPPKESQKVCTRRVYFIQAYV
jgi:hypothetical protein